MEVSPLVIIPAQDCIFLEGKTRVLFIFTSLATGMRSGPQRKFNTIDVL